MALYKAVLDTCVIESALRSRRGASYQLLRHLQGHAFRCGISTALYLEYEYRLLRGAAEGEIQVSQQGIQAILAALAYYGDEVSIYYNLRPNLKDENDNMVFECCVNYATHYLVTFNVRDFVQAELTGYPFEVVTPAKFLKQVAQR